jgi:thioredoxin reductase (NADPH)
MNEDTVIVGAGPIGLACAISARRRGIDPLVIDAGALVNSVFHYPVGMSFFTTPELLEIGGHPFPCSGAKPTREEALKYYRGVARTERLRVRTYTKLLRARHEDDGLVCELSDASGSQQLHCHRLVLATGYYDNPNLLDISGEDLPHVSHYFDEAHGAVDLDVVVIGGKNSAIEAALDLFRAGARATLVYRGKQFRKSVKYWLRPDIENRIAAGEIKAYLGAQVTGIDERHVTIRTSGGENEKLRADRVYALTGFHPDSDLFRRIGIEIDPVNGRPTLDPDTLETNVPGVFMAGSITAGYKISEIFIENGRFDGEKIFGGERLLQPNP